MELSARSPSLAEDRPATPTNQGDTLSMNDFNAPIETLFAGKWLSLRRRGRWEYVERNTPGGAVIILAVTEENKVLFVEQFRAAIQQKTIEMPAGLVGDLAGQSDEGPLLAAQRELEEETGYRCQRVAFIHAGPSSSGMLSLIHI